MAMDHLWKRLFLRKSNLSFSSNFIKNNVILSVGIDVVFYETEKLTVVGLSNKYLSRPQLLAREKFEYKKS